MNGEWNGIEKSVHRERNESKNRVFHKISWGETVWTPRILDFIAVHPTQLNPACFKKLIMLVRLLVDNYLRAG